MDGEDGRRLKPKVLVIGLGDSGAQLVQRLTDTWDVVGVDVDPAALRALEAQLPPERRPTLVPGDATSALVLRRVAPGGVRTALACTGSDEVNLEALRLAASELGAESRTALLIDPGFADRYRAAGIDAVSRGGAAAAALAGRVDLGRRVATNVGLGQGEIVEVSVLPGSMLVGRTLRELHPRRWLIAAVYRAEQVVIPHGDTRIEAGDRVLIVGEPEILPAIAALASTGESEFPLQFGSHVVSACGSQLPAILPEVGYLLAETEADRFEVIACAAEPEPLRALTAACEAAQIPHSVTCQAEGTLPSLAEAAAQRDVGLFVLPPGPLSLWARIGLRRAPSAAVFDRLRSPVLVCRKTFPYRRVLLGLAELPLPTALVQLALDLVRKLQAELHLGVVHQPDIVVGSERRSDMDERRREIEALAAMYHVPLQSLTLSGNPIAEFVRVSKDFDLLLLPWTPGRRVSLTRPSITLNVAHRAACSVMVLPQ